MSMKLKSEQELILGSRKTNQDSAMQFIKEVVARYYGMDVSCFDMNRIRKKELVKVRQVSMFLIAKNIKVSLVDIGKHFGKDHSTVIHARRTIENYLSWDKDLQREVSELENAIRVKVSVKEGSFNLENDFYYIDLNNISSLKVSKTKSIILSGFTDEEVKRISQMFKSVPEQRKHKNTGMYILEKNKKNEEDKNNTQGV